MKGYDVQAFDGHKIGQVVDVEDGFIVFEHGHLHKTKQALPDVSATVDDEEQVVHSNLSKKLIYESPKVDGDLDREAIAQHYGLAEGFTDPPTRGRGWLNDDDPAFGSDDGVQERVTVREGMTSGHGRLDDAPDSGMHGSPRAGDYTKD